MHSHIQLLGIFIWISYSYQPLHAQDGLLFLTNSALLPLVKDLTSGNPGLWLGNQDVQIQLVAIPFTFTPLSSVTELPRWLSGKESACQRMSHRRRGLDIWVRKIPCRRKWQPTLVFPPRESHRPKSLEGYSPWNCKESDMAEWAQTHISYSLPIIFIFIICPRLGHA